MVNMHRAQRQFERFMGTSYEEMMRPSYPRTRVITSPKDDASVLATFYYDHDAKRELCLDPRRGTISFYLDGADKISTFSYTIDIESRKYVFPKEIKNYVLSHPKLSQETADYFI